MKEASVRMDSSVVSAVGGTKQAGDRFAEYDPVFERDSRGEQDDVTLAGRDLRPEHGSTRA